MATEVLFDNSTHKNIILEDFSHGDMVQANVHLIVDSGKGMILDPGGHKVFKHLLQEVGVLSGIDSLEFLFFSHQDPDIVAAANGWLMTTKAKALASRIWLRFIAHFGIDRMFSDRFIPLEDRGGIVKLGGAELYILPAHWLHSPGNFHVYDPVSKILYSGDLGASIGQNYRFVDNFDEHIKYMEGFHRRYMTTGKVIKNWVKMVRQLDIEIIAPQHGAIFKGKQIVSSFLDWLESLDTGVDIMDDVYQIPSQKLAV